MNTAAKYSHKTSCHKVSVYQWMCRGMGGVRLDRTGFMWEYWACSGVSRTALSMPLYS